MLQNNLTNSRQTPPQLWIFIQSSFGYGLSVGLSVCLLLDTVPRFQSVISMQRRIKRRNKSNVRNNNNNKTIDTESGQTTTILIPKSHRWETWNEQRHCKGKAVWYPSVGLVLFHVVVLHPVPPRTTRVSSSSSSFCKSFVHYNLVFLYSTSKNNFLCQKSLCTPSVKATKVTFAKWQWRRS